MMGPTALAIAAEDRSSEGSKLSAKARSRLDSLLLGHGSQSTADAHGPHHIREDMHYSEPDSPTLCLPAWTPLVGVYSSW